MARRPASAPTRADVVLEQLRSDILNGRVEPGARLGFADLGARYDVSTGVLREVLPRLVERGLATSEPQLGFRVITVSVEQLTELTDARVALETMMTRTAIETADVTWETGVVAAHHALARTTTLDADQRLSSDWLSAHDDFHLAILRGCRNRYLFETTARLRSVAEVYRCWSLPAQERAHRDVAAEHREIMQAAIDRDAAMASALTERHIRRTTDLLVASRQTPVMA